MLKVYVTLDEVGLVRIILAAVNAVGPHSLVMLLFIIAVLIFINLKMNINERFMEIGTMRALGVEVRVGGLRFFIFESVSLALVFSIIEDFAGCGNLGALRLGPAFPRSSPKLLQKGICVTAYQAGSLPPLYRLSPFSLPCFLSCPEGALILCGGA